MSYTFSADPQNSLLLLAIVDRVPPFSRESIYICRDRAHHFAFTHLKIREKKKHQLYSHKTLSNWNKPKRFARILVFVRFHKQEENSKFLHLALW